MNRIVVATLNRGKLPEIERRLVGLGYAVSSLADFDETMRIVEDADTFEGNAIKKARAVCDAFGYPTISDDSGLEVDALLGKPGVFSARYGGPGLDDKGRYTFLLQEISAVPVENRNARFRAVLACCRPQQEPLLFQGVLEGKIALEPAGNHGFGYDPVFIPEGYDKTLAELGPDVKDKISHRAMALDAFAKSLSHS